MITENLSTLKIHKLTQEQYDTALANGNIDNNALYLTPDEEVDLSKYATTEQLNDKADATHTHDDIYYTETEIDARFQAELSGLISDTVADGKITTHNTSTDAHSDIRTLIDELRTKLNNFLDVDEETTDQLSEVLALIENNKGTLDSITTLKVNVSDIIDNLTTSSADKVLSAKQGVAIKTLIDELQAAVDGKADTKHSHVIADVSGLKDALNGKQATITGAVSTLTTNDLTTNRALVSNGMGKIGVSSVTDGELSLLSGIKTNVQTQLDGKQRTITGAATSIASADLTTNRVLISSTSGKVVVSDITSTELGYLDGATGNIQQQITNLNTNKAPTVHTHTSDQVTDLQAKLDAINAEVDKCITGLSVSGTTITYTLNDGSTDTITTQDENTDTNVTNTLNTTAKAYVTGTTSDTTNTGTQVFDTGVYLGETAGQLVASQFHGNLIGNADSATQAVQDGNGAVITATYETKTDAETKLTESKAYADGILATHITDVENKVGHLTNTERNNWNAAYTHSQEAHAPADAEKNQNAFSNISAGGTTITADSATDTLTIEGSNVTITPNATNDKITISVADGTTSQKGVVQLTNSTSSTSTTTAATPNSVKTAYDLATTAKTAAATAQSTADGKQATITGGASTITSSNLTISRALISNTSGKVAVSDITSTELGYLDGVKSNIQEQLDSKTTKADLQSLASEVMGELDEVYEAIDNKLPTLTKNRALISDTSGQVAVSAITSTELGYLDGVDSNIQEQLDSIQRQFNSQLINKADSSHSHSEYALSQNPHFTGTLSMNGCTATAGGTGVALGVNCVAGEGMGCFAVGNSAQATASSSVAMGNQVTANQAYQTVVGICNDTTKDGYFVIGNGTSNTSRSNAFRVTSAGKPYSKSSLTTTGADYAEFFEWKDLNPDNEDRRGYFVTLDEDKIKIAEPNDYILGIISGQPSVIGNGDEDWMGRYVFDEFGAFVYEDFEYEVEIPEKIQEEIIDKETNETTIVTKTVMKTVKKTGKKYKENPDYDPTRPYIQREDRPEWDTVGMLGVLSVRDDGTCQVNGYCKVAEGGIATASETGYRVIKRVSDNVVKVIYR